MNAVLPQQEGSEFGFEFTVGGALSRTFSTLTKNPAIFMGLTAIAVVLPIAVQLLSMGNPLVIMVSNLLSLVLGLLVQGAIAFGVYQALLGQKAGFGETISRAGAHMWRMFLAALLMGIGIMLGTILLVIPGIILACAWAVTLPACVVEGLGAVDSLKRSMELTKGFRLKIFGLVIVAGIAMVLFMGVVVALVLILPGAGETVIVAGTALALIAPQAFYSVMMPVVYYDLRQVREGVTLDNLTNVFD